MTRRLVPALVALLVAAPALPGQAVAGTSKSSFDLSIPLSVLAGQDGRFTLTCDTDDSENGEMMDTLARRSRSTWQSRDGDSRVTASRRGGKFRLRAWENGRETLDLRMPWAVAECLFGAREGQTVVVDADDIRADGGLHLNLSGSSADLGLSID